MNYLNYTSPEEIKETDKILHHIESTTNFIADPYAIKILEARTIEELLDLYNSRSIIREELIYLRMCTRRKNQILAGQVCHNCGALRNEGV